MASREAVTPDELRAFERDGYIIVERLFDAEEIGLLQDIARADRRLRDASYARRDGEGGEIRLSVENTVGDDIYGAFVRCRRVVDRMEALLGDEVYHYHHKTILKDPKVGGAWEWHQDYGYWYDLGCLWPDMGSCMVAIDRATKVNGCLQVLRGSHRLGRITHFKSGDQSSADPERVAEALPRLELAHCELEPGSALLFHANLLHRSDQNRSPDPRWAFISCYNTKHNDPYKETRHPRYSKLDRWPDERVKEIGRQQWAAMNRHESGSA